MFGDTKSCCFHYNIAKDYSKPKQTGSCGRGIRNEHMSNTNTIATNIKCYGTNSIYLLSILYAILYCPSQTIYLLSRLYAILYCPSQTIYLLSRLYAILLSITKKTAGIWNFGIVDEGLSSAHNCQFVLVLL